MVTERVAIWDFFNVKDCDFCLKLCRILNKLKKKLHIFLEEIYKTKKFYTIHIKNEYSEKTGAILKYSHNKESFEMNDRRI